jgi:hypothetical protein
MRSLALAAALLLAAMPPWIHDGSLIVMLSVLAAALMLGGLLGPSLLAAAAGGALALAAYALALWSSSAAPGLLDALAIGIALVLMLDAADFARTFRGAEISPDVIRIVRRSWIASAALGAAAVIGLAWVVALADLGAPPVARPLLAGAGAFLALAAALLLLTRR